jgi:secreted Zn-dependent insulinase-like peptidase
MSANFPRKIEVIEMSNNYQRKMSIFDELSLNVDKKLEVSSRRVQNGVSAHSIKTTDESRLSDIQIETTAVEKESHNNTEQCIEEITEEIKNIDKPPDGQEFFERRLIPNHSLFIIHNEVQSASCVEFYFECISSTFAVLEFFVHLVRLKIVEYIKQIMSLGYVVTCDIRRVSDNHGMQVIVQSQYPLTVVYATVENAISSLKDFLSTIDAESFERNRASLLTNKREMLFSRMRDVANLLWIEMAESTYNFRRTEHEISQIELISLEQIVEFYVNKICVDGLDRRLLIISIGPDAILNRLDDESIRHWTSKEIEEFRDTSTKCRQKRVTVDRLNSWLQNVFDSKESEYYPPQLENVEK